MRIITGKYKGRHFDIPRTFKARPTTDFAKENIFNVLNAYIDFDDATALDLFAGTGSISLELLSRGCKQVVSVELDRDHHRFIQACLRKLVEGRTDGAARAGESSLSVCRVATEVDRRSESRERGSENVPAILIRGDVFRFLKTCKQQFDFIFADPPYALKELAQIPDLVFGAVKNVAEANSSLLTLHSSLLKPGGIFVLEHGKDYDFSGHPHFVEHRQYGSVNFSLFR